MIPEIGLLALIIALLFSLFVGILPFIGSNTKYTWKISNYYTYGQVFFILIAYLSLTIAFLQNDFTVFYVWSHSSLTLPLFYKLCAVWGGHEGSMLLWETILSLWMLTALYTTKNLEIEFKLRFMSILGFLSFGFIAFILITSNPFLRVFANLNSNGQDLNPLLQDPGFLLHPPMLYMGYVGFSIAYAYALTSLWLKKVEISWTKWVRPWTLASWAFLTLGITLGSWWAYRELGWGGWWFWDPVENASFMPWLAGIALIHALMVYEKRKAFKGWVILLAIISFSLSLIGTFLVRSGILVSVHAFAVDPNRGIFILILLLIAIGGPFLLYAFRIPEKLDSFSLASRESFLFLNQILLLCALGSILLGTIYPLLIDVLKLGKLSVGAPYFNLVFTPFMAVILILMGFGIHFSWHHDTNSKIKIISIFIANVIGIALFILFLAPFWSVLAWFGLSICLFVILTTLYGATQRLLQKHKISQGYLAMLLAHIGIAVTSIGIIISSIYGMQIDMACKLNKTFNFAGYSIKALSEDYIKMQNYHGIKLNFIIKSKENRFFLSPEKRIYNVSKIAMTDADIHASITQDLYIALGEKIDNNTWGIRIYYKPFVRLIWGGGILMFLGAIVGLTHHRYYRKSK